MIEKILEERNKIHGDFSVDAGIAQALKRMLRAGPSWSKMNAIQCEAIEHMCTKMARIVSGDPHHPDHWDDLIGYPTLAKRSLPEAKMGYVKS